LRQRRASLSLVKCVRLVLQIAGCTPNDTKTAADKVDVTESDRAIADGRDEGMRSKRNQMDPQAIISIAACVIHSRAARPFVKHFAYGGGVILGKYGLEKINEAIGTGGTDQTPRGGSGRPAAAQYHARTSGLAQNRLRRRGWR